MCGKGFLLERPHERPRCCDPGQGHDVDSAGKVDQAVARTHVLPDDLVVIPCPHGQQEGGQRGVDDVGLQLGPRRLACCHPYRPNCDLLHCISALPHGLMASSFREEEAPTAPEGVDR